MADKEKDLYLGADVTVRRGTDEKPKFETIPGGKMVSDTELKPDEVKDLKRRGIIRRATDADRAALDAAERAAGEEEDEDEVVVEQRFETGAPGAPTPPPTGGVVTERTTERKTAKARAGSRKR